MKYKVLRLVESTNTDIKRMQQDLYARERQALKDLGDPNWEDLVGLKDRLPQEQFDAFMKEEGKIRAIEMIHSILTYAEPENWTTDYIMSNKYMKRYIEELGEDAVVELANQEIEEYKNNAIVDKDTYTDSEGVTYNSVRFKNESAMTENLKENNNYNEYVSVKDLGITDNVKDRERYDDEQFKKSGAGMITSDNPNSLKNKHNAAVRAQNAIYELEDYYKMIENNFTGNTSSMDFETKKILFDINNILSDFGFKATINKALGTNNFDACLNYIKIIITQLNEIKNSDLNGKLTEDVDTGKDLENDSVDEVVDNIQDETTAEEEEETSTLDAQLEDLREVLPDLELNLYQVTDKEDKSKVFYFIGKVAEDSNDLLMLIDNNPSEDIDEPSKIDNELPEDKSEEVDDLTDEETKIEEPELDDESKEDRFDFMKVPLKYEDFATLNPRYGNEMNPDHEAIMEYLMKCLVEENPERAEELSKEDNIEADDNTKVPLNSDIQKELDDKMEYYASKF